jgi:hypothetical protein
MPSTAGKHFLKAGYLLSRLGQVLILPKFRFKRRRPSIDMFKITWTHSVPFGGKRYRFSGRPAPKNRNRKASGKTQWFQKPLHCVHNRQ